MTVKQAIKVLKKHNNWRRGGYSHPQDPKIIGEAIDVAVAIIEHYTTTGEIDRVHVNTDKLK